MSSRLNERSCSNWDKASSFTLGRRILRVFFDIPPDKMFCMTFCFPRARNRVGEPRRGVSVGDMLKTAALLGVCRASILLGASEDGAKSLRFLDFCEESHKPGDDLGIFFCGISVWVELIATATFSCAVVVSTRVGVCLLMTTTTSGRSGNKVCASQLHPTIMRRRVQAT